MPFQIIRNDITKVHVDAIVNTANPEPVYASGTDGAVYMAAGADQLLKERRRIGQLRTGEAIVTKAFRLPATYIIHTVGPSWWDGSHGEFKDLASCYPAEWMNLHRRVAMQVESFLLYHNFIGEFY